MTILDLAALAPCALAVCIGATIIIGEAISLACDWINRREP